LKKNQAVHRYGTIAENKALEYLSTQGLVRLRNNFRSRYGEIDLIMQDDETIVFIEVRYRSNARFVDPLETIDGIKIRKIILTSQKFLQEFSDRDKLYRFDVVTLMGDLESPEIQWIKNAFSV
jgi:putative endonuclease